MFGSALLYIETIEPSPGTEKRILRILLKHSYYHTAGTIKYDYHPGLIMYKTMVNSSFSTAINATICLLSVANTDQHPNDAILLQFR